MLSFPLKNNSVIKYTNKNIFSYLWIDLIVIILMEKR